MFYLLYYLDDFKDNKMSDFGPQTRLQFCFFKSVVFLALPKNLQINVKNNLKKVN